ncbi:hypothetical protein IWW34DRAFT_786943 [Fusarium oxysporum f. sp. albedinis]|nr:hypothetical protein IWW34DRAFT_786943 [Fusarium oxysporum f. sp. albedinis]
MGTGITAQYSATQCQLRPELMLELGRKDWKVWVRRGLAGAGVPGRLEGFKLKGRQEHGIGNGMGKMRDGVKGGRLRTGGPEMGLCCCGWPGRPLSPEPGDWTWTFTGWTGRTRGPRAGTNFNDRNRTRYVRRHPAAPLWVILLCDGRTDLDDMDWMPLVPQNEPHLELQRESLSLEICLYIVAFVSVLSKIVSLETVFDSSFGLVVLFIVGIFSSGRLEIDLVIIRKYLGVMICAEPKRAASSDISDWLTPETAPAAGRGEVDTWTKVGNLKVRAPSGCGVFGYRVSDYITHCLCLDWGSLESQD